MIPLAMIAQRTVWSSCIVQLSIFAMVLVSSYYLPVYFQAVKNESPMMSGLYLLPSILSQLIVAVVSGLLSKYLPNMHLMLPVLTINSVSRLGYYLPWAIFCGVLTSIGSGLISTYGPHTPTAKWVGYQILLGAGRGAGFQMVRDLPVQRRSIHQLTSSRTKSPLLPCRIPSHPLASRLQCQFSCLFKHCPAPYSLPWEILFSPPVSRNLYPNTHPT